jgi:hypothetical protein
MQGEWGSAFLRVFWCYYAFFCVTWLVVPFCGDILVIVEIFYLDCTSIGQMGLSFKA